MRPPPLGNPILFWLYELEKKYSGIQIDSYCIMPDHIHFILVITGAHTGAPLPELIKWYKTQTTNAYIRLVKKGLLSTFQKHIWQRGYYEHIIRNDIDLAETRQYIQINPLNWTLRQGGRAAQYGGPYDPNG